MTSPTRQPQAPESYATFWEPLATDTPPAPTSNPGSNSGANSAATKDAYLEFVNVTEGTLIPLRADRA
jgi:hypothetical protein